MKIPQIQPWIDGTELEYLTEVIESTFITEHRMTERFLEEIKKLTGAPYAIAVGNGTLALISALLAEGVGPGDEVIVPDITFIASANAVRLVGATPVFCDVRYPDGSMTAETVSAVLTDRTVAIMPVHLYGGAAPMGELMKLAKNRGLTVIEDAAESFACLLDGRHTGTFGEYGTFSFFANKTITCGEGGVVLTDSAERYQQLYRIKNHGRDRRGTFVHEHYGYNFCFTDLQAAVGMAQLTKLDRILASKRRNYDFYRELLADVEGLDFIEYGAEIAPNYWFNNVLVDDPEHLGDWLEARDIESRRLFFPMHRQPCFAHAAAESDRGFTNASRLYNRGLSLPSGATLTSAELELVGQALLEYATDQRGA